METKIGEEVYSHGGFDWKLKSYKEFDKNKYGGLYIYKNILRSGELGKKTLYITTSIHGHKYEVQNDK